MRSTRGRPATETVGVTIGEPTEIVPGTNLPREVHLGASNNNLDIALHAGRLWFAWRTSKTHFASAGTTVYIVSSSDMGQSWEYEHRISPDRDIREPRFLSFGGDLFIYWFEAGTNAIRFEPGTIYASRLEKDGWSSPTPISEPGYVVWRPRVIDDRALMSVYSGGESLYTAHPVATEVELWQSRDGFEWSPAIPDERVIHVGGTETEFQLAPDGGLLALTRKEGPHGGWGTDVCVTDPDDWSEWRCRSHRSKLDSPLMFINNGRYFVIARRQPAFRGHYDLGLNFLPAILQTRLYQGLYSATTKRTALYEIDPGNLDIRWITDLPSRGDTAFAGIVETSPDEYLVYNYSSPLEARDRVWIEGQLQETRIYATTLRFG